MISNLIRNAYTRARANHTRPCNWQTHVQILITNARGAATRTCNIKSRRVTTMFTLLPGPKPWLWDRRVLVGKVSSVTISFAMCTVIFVACKRFACHCQDNNNRQAYLVNLCQVPMYIHIDNQLWILLCTQCQSRPPLEKLPPPDSGVASQFDIGGHSWALNGAQSAPEKFC